jgi:DNA mismatch endonuclease, patch repair protein
MTDSVPKAKRSQMMAGIRSKNTKPELLVRSYLHRQGFRFRLHAKKLPGHPDIVLAKYRAAIFVHGCFWHQHPGCKYAYEPKSRQEFWRHKFDRNVERDQEVRQALIESGWRVMVVWECGLKTNAARDHGLATVAEWIKSRWPTGEYPANPHLST